jgi:hypothetical protein
MKLFRLAMVVMIATSMLFGVGAAYVFAQGQSIAAQAVGVKSVASVVGMRADIWTASHPSGWYAIGSPVGICTSTPPCSSSGNYFETGFVKGTITPSQNVLQQYVAFKNGSVTSVYGLGNLSNNTWYKFDVYYNPNVSKWEASRNYAMVYRAPTNLSYTSGQMVGCGAEGGDIGVPLAVECHDMLYKLTNVAWQYMDYTGTQTWGVGYYYCVYKPYTYGAIGWGPC